jgi:hypothetical protein
MGEKGHEKTHAVQLGGGIGLARRDCRVGFGRRYNGGNPGCWSVPIPP